MNHRYNLSRCAGIFMLALPVSLFAQTTFYAVLSPDDDAGTVSVLDVLTGAETNVLPVTLDNVQVDGCTGMALDPSSGLVYVVAKMDSIFHLATLDVNTGILGAITTMSERFSGLAFDETGTLYGVTGDGSNTPETIYAIDTDDGSLTLVAQPGTGSDGEALAYNYDNGLLYRYGGDNLFQTIDPSTGTVTDMFLSGPSVGNSAHALFYNGGNFTFTAASTAYVVSLSGSVVQLGNLQNSAGYKGLVSTAAVGVNELDAEAPAIFPNPATDNITIVVPKGGIDRLRIHDATGALVQDIRLNGAPRYTQGVAHLAAGPYTLEVQDGIATRCGTFTVTR